MDVVFNVEKQFIDGKTTINIQILKEVPSIKISAADMIWDMFSFRLEDLNNSLIQTGNFHVIESRYNVLFMICRRSGRDYRVS